jgi:hypothetical protein
MNKIAAHNAGEEARRRDAGLCVCPHAPPVTPSQPSQPQHELLAYGPLCLVLPSLQQQEDTGTVGVVVRARGIMPEEPMRSIGAGHTPPCSPSPGRGRTCTAGR